MNPPTPQAQLTVYHHYTSKRGALLVSVNGNEDEAKWLSGSQCSVYHINRRTLVLTMPEWLAVKVGFMQKGALTFGGNHDKFQDRPEADSRTASTAEKSANE